jgi:NDP-sugar pyrophosphorylase family protein
MSLPVAILAGGTATRLRPVTEAIPKALVDVAGKPFIVRALEYLRGQGTDSVVLCIGYLGEQIEAAIGDGSRYGLTVRYSHDGPHLLGTGGALRRALELLGASFFVLYGDSYLPIDFRAVERAYQACGKPALMTVLRNDDRWDKSNVLFRDGRIFEYNKHRPRPEMAHIDYGLTVLSASVIAARPAGLSFDLADVYHELSVQDLLAGHEVFERFYEMGSFKGLSETIEYFRKEDAAHELRTTTSR